MEQRIAFVRQGQLAVADYDAAANLAGFVDISAKQPLGIIVDDPVTLVTSADLTPTILFGLAGLAVMRLPATVPWLRIWGAPTSQAARASGKARS